MEVRSQLHAPVCFIAVERGGTHLIGGEVVSIAGMDAVAMRKESPSPAGNRTPCVQTVA
jgi:hypothetical protein